MIIEIGKNLAYVLQALIVAGAVNVCIYFVFRFFISKLF